MGLKLKTAQMIHFGVDISNNIETKTLTQNDYWAHIEMNMLSVILQSVHTLE